MSNNFSKEAILETIKSYLNEKSIDGAILIDGKWGVGKTYFIKKELIEKKDEYIDDKNKEIKDIIYISLYGITDLANLEKILFKKIMFNSDKDNNKEMPHFLSQISFDIAMQTLGIKITADVKAKEFWNQIINICGRYQSSKSKYLIIFDDLERCDISLKILLGYINQLVEHEKQKVIILANEEEINKSIINENKELKYISAGVYKNIKDKNNLKEESEKDENQENYRLDKVALKLYANDTYFNQIKEKLIYQIIKYKPNKKEIIESIINDLEVENKIRKILLKNVDNIKETFEVDQSFNFNARIAKYLIINLKRILEDIDKRKIEEYDSNKVIENIIVSSTKITLDVKTYNKELDDFKNEIVEVNVGGRNKYCIKSIVYFFRDSFLDTESLNRELVVLNDMLSKKEI